MTGETELPLDAMSDGARKRSLEKCESWGYSFAFSIDPKYGYISEYYYFCGEGMGMEVLCFAANTLDPEACRDERGFGDPR